MVISIFSKKILPLAMLVAATAIAYVMYLNRPTSETSEPVYVPVTIDVAQVVQEDLRIPIQAQGSVSALRKTNLVSEVSGNIVEVSSAFNVGGYVSAGDVILRIDPRNYQTRLLRAQAALESTNSNLAQEKGRAQVALNEWERLPKGSQRSQAAKDLYLRKPQMGQAEAQSLAAQADLNTARDDLERTVIRSPYDALISKKSSELGQFVGVGTPLAEIFSVDYAEVRLAIPQSKLAYIDLPGLADVETLKSQVDLYTDVSGDLKHWLATLHRTEGTYDERSRVLFTVARIADPYALKNDSAHPPLRIGTFVNANIQGKLQSNLVALPRYILRAGNNVWTIDKNQQLRNRKLTLLRTGGDTMYVTAGLQDGDLVSLTALDSTFAGATVNIVSSTKTNAASEPTGKTETLPELTSDTGSSDSTISESSQIVTQSNAG